MILAYFKIHQNSNSLQIGTHTGWRQKATQYDFLPKVTVERATWLPKETDPEQYYLQALASQQLTTNILWCCDVGWNSSWKWWWNKQLEKSDIFLTFYCTHISCIDRKVWTQNGKFLSVSPPWLKPWICPWIHLSACSSGLQHHISAQSDCENNWLPSNTLRSTAFFSFSQCLW